MHRLALTVGEKHNARILRVSGHFSAALDSHDSPLALVFLHIRVPIFKRSHSQASHRAASTGSRTMPSLYDLLGALPGDDAGNLRKAFREAVKGVHPDIRPGDPEAALNFRLIIRAMEILDDPDQRAAYDHLLEHARQEFEQEQRAARIRNFAFAMIGLACVSIVAVSVHILFAPMAPLPPQSGQTDKFPRGPDEIASNSPSARPGLNDNSASRDRETSKPAESQDDFLARWGANDINVPADRKAEAAKPVEDEHHLTSRLDTNENHAATDRNAEIATTAKPRDDLPPAPSGNENNVPVDRKAEAAKPAEDEHRLTSRLDTNENNAATDRNAEIATTAKSRDDLPPPPGANENNVSADRKAEAAKPAEEEHQLTSRPDTNENNAATAPNAELATTAKSPDDPPPQPGANENNVPADRNAETATVSKEPETSVVHAPAPKPPARHDDADGTKALVEPHDESDPSAAMHAQGIAAYRNGDLKLALADFDRAIALNPTFMIAYINRGIVLYRMGKLDRALADVARARQIDRAGRARSAAAVHRADSRVAAE
jgi:curved DNA-binding protein CbpA